MKDFELELLKKSYPKLPDPLPCPFCGEEPVLQHDRRWPDEAGNEGCSAFEVVCKTWGCPVYCADTSYYRTPEEAIQAWNRRKSHEID